MTEKKSKIVFVNADANNTAALRESLSNIPNIELQAISAKQLSDALVSNDSFFVLSAEEITALLQEQKTLTQALTSARAEIEIRTQERTVVLAEAIETLREQVRETQAIEQEIRQQNRELAILNSIPAAISSSLEISEVLLVLKQQLSHQLGIPGGCIFSFDTHHNAFLLREHWGIPAEILPRIQKFKGHLFPANEILQTRKPFLFPDVRQVPFYLELKMHEASPQWQSCLLVPLLADGAMQGVVGLFSTIVFDAAQMAFFATFGRQVGAAFHHARLFEQVYAARERTQVLSQRLVEIQEEERRNIARELHDEIGQILTGLKLILEMSLRLPPEESKTNVREAQGLVGELMSKVRQISLDLRPGMLDDLGLLPALLWYFERYTAQTKVHVAFSHSQLEGRRFSPPIETAAYRIVQEALTNVARHAGVKKVTVDIWSDTDILYVHIEDTGQGFDPEAALHANYSSGVAGMGERARLLGGGLTIESKPGNGARITANFPLWNEGK